MPSPAVQRSVSALFAPLGVLLTFEAVQFRRYRVGLSGLPDRCLHLPATTGRCPRGDRSPGVSAVTQTAHCVVCVRVNKSWLLTSPLRRLIVRVDIA